MKIVIDISDAMYDHLHDIVYDDYALDDYELAIFNGTPLPDTNVGYMDCIKDSTTDSSTTDSDSTTVEPEKCSDYISRQAVIDRINKLIEVEKKQGTDDWGYGRERVNAYETMLHFVKSEYLHPSVEPERKPGKWIRAIDPDVNAWTGGHTCSECGRACVQMSMNYCANCGAPMEVEA